MDLNKKPFLPPDEDRSTSKTCRCCLWTRRTQRRTATPEIEKMSFGYFSTCAKILCFFLNSSNRGEKQRDFSHPVICGGDHQSVWQQDGSFGLLDVFDGHHWDGDLGHRTVRSFIPALKPEKKIHTPAGRLHCATARIRSRDELFTDLRQL